MGRGAAILLLSLLLAGLPLRAIAADIYRWVDEKGIVHFTDNPHNIPEKFRAGTNRIKAKESAPDPRALKSLSPDKASVPMQRKGDIVIVQATLNERAEVNFVVDTGASYTMISRATAKELSIDLNDKFPTMPFQTANGVVRAPLIKLESIDVGGLQIQDLVAAVHDVFPDPSISGLLGLNFLSNFRLDIDTRGAVLHLERK
jgi:clan AA aspartic protease (TIGR02281 family)